MSGLVPLLACAGFVMAVIGGWGLVALNAGQLRQVGRPGLEQIDPQIVLASQMRHGGALDVAGAGPGVTPLYAPEQARLWNASNPHFEGPNPSAAPFFIASRTMSGQDQAADCLAAAVYYEAGGEALDGQRAVAQVVLNRVRHPAYPKTICGVVFEGSHRVTGCQFTFTCDGSLDRPPSPARWKHAHMVAEAALDGYVEPEVGHATHYHAAYVAPPWSLELVKVATVGAHIFYRWPGRNGRPVAFTQAYSDQEPETFRATRVSAATGVAAATHAPELVPATLEPAAPLEVEERPVLQSDALPQADIAKMPSVPVIEVAVDARFESSRAPRLALPSDNL